MRFYVNVDHVATVRQARRTIEPDPVEAALACLLGGADGITMHLREDRRHIVDDDVRGAMRELPSRIPLNLELASAEDIVALAVTLRPHQATFVPERREEITTEGGLDLLDRSKNTHLADCIAHLQSVGIRVSLFIDPDLPTIDAAARLNVEAIELHTGAYANAFPSAQRAVELLRTAASHAHEGGLAVHAGHGLTTDNVTAVAAIPEVEELNIGHHVVSRSILLGIETATRQMRRIIDSARVD